jgi:hypothetical protein
MGCWMSIDYFYTQNTVPVTGEKESRKKNDAWRKYLCNIHYEDIVTSPRSMNTTHSHTITQTHQPNDSYLSRLSLKKNTVIWMKSRGNLACNFFGEIKPTILMTLFHRSYHQKKTATLIKEITIILKKSPCMITFFVTTLDRNYTLCHQHPKDLISQPFHFCKHSLIFKCGAE